MSGASSLDDLWNAAPSSTRAFEAAPVVGLPVGAQHYLLHAIAVGTPLASAVRLRMHGEIRLKGRWYPFSAEQVISWGRGMIWRAAARMHGISIRGSDSFLGGCGVMKWKLFGILPVVNASGPDITRSAAGRVNIESMWLPSVLCGDGVSWTASDTFRPHARFTAHEEVADLKYLIDEEGRLRTVEMPRWGNPDGTKFGYTSFGGIVETERTFGGYTIPSRMRAGWYFDSDRFDSDGEFFRVTIDDAIYR